MNDPVLGSDQKNLFGVLKLGLRNSPAVTKIAIAALVLFAVATAVSYNRVPLSVSIFVAVVVLVLGVVATLVAAFATAPGKKGSLLGHFTAWCFVGTFLVATSLVMSATFFGWPAQGSLFIARLMNAPELIRSDSDVTSPITVKSDMAVGQLDPIVLAEVTTSDPIDAVAQLAKKPPVSVHSSRITLSGPEEKRVLSASRLELDNAVIVTNGGTLVVEAREIVSNNGVIRSFEQPEQPGRSHDGTPGGTVTLRIYGAMQGILTVNLSGQAGTSGADGRSGTPGSQGAEGEHSSSGALDCSHGPGRGGRGGPGGNGGPGQAGGNGGDGGRLQVEAKEPLALKERISFSAAGGTPGPGGKGGPGGTGGPGGNGGASGGWCTGRGAAGEQGPNGADGPNGQAGRRGGDGLLIVN